MSFLAGFLLGMVVELALLVCIAMWKPPCENRASSDSNSKEEILSVGWKPEGNTGSFVSNDKEKILEAAMRGELDGFMFQRTSPLRLADLLRDIAEKIELQVEEGQKIADELCS